MCGLAGIVDLGGLDRGAARHALERALGRLAPRGPDGQGTWIDARAALAHRRLAVIDLSEAAAQPMPRGAGVIAYNGEIYNHAALRQALRSQGHGFATASDTEVLLAGWQAWGPALLDRLEGMFAFALWDAAKGELVLARDRFGKKPLVYARDGRRIAFASDLAALRALGAGGGVDPAALRLFLGLKYVPEPFCIQAGAAKLPPGHWARFTDGGLAVRRWYDLAAARPRRIADAREAEARLVPAFDAAVAKRLAGDVPVGAYLSGGIDSALVAASMVRAAAAVDTFTVGFPGSPAYFEERPAAAAVARHLGTRHHEIAVGPDEALGAVDALFDALDEPFGDASALPSFLLARATRARVKVVLSGDGGDEVFGGYRKHQGELWAAAHGRLPSWLGAAAARAAGVLPARRTTRLGDAVRRARRFLDHAGRPPAERQAAWARLLQAADVDRLLGPAPGAATPEALFAAARAAAREDDPLNAMLAAEIAVVLAGDMLPKIDRTAMAHGLEVRCPFLDHAVVELAAAMAGPLKLARGEGKRVLRRAFAGRLPPHVFRLPKKGFEPPIAAWLRGPLAGLVDRAVDPASLARLGVRDTALPGRWRAALLRGCEETAEPLWALVALTQWAARRGLLA